MLYDDEKAEFEAFIKAIQDPTLYEDTAEERAEFEEFIKAVQQLSDTEPEQATESKGRRNERADQRRKR